MESQIQNKSNQILLSNYRFQSQYNGGINFRYFLLVMKLMVTTKDGRRRLIQAFQSERVIVRASNPGQFEQPEAEIAWQKTQTMDGHGCLAFRCKFSSFKLIS